MLHLGHRDCLQDLGLGVFHDLFLAADKRGLDGSAFIRVHPRQKTIL
jgi:hypothetical protein